MELKVQIDIWRRSVYVFQSHLYGIERLVAVSVWHCIERFNRTFMELKDLKEIRL